MRVREEAIWWLETAKRDIKRAERSLEHGDRAAATFWAEQAAEKALKALHIAFKGTIPKIHSIKRLFEELGTNLGLDEEVLEAAYELTQYYYLSHYPDIVEGVPDEVISSATAERAVRVAKRIVEAAERALEEAFSSSS